MLIEIHVLQNLSPSNPNRDDTGAPKMARFGCVDRQRISSQSNKRSIREYPGFQEALKGHLGLRTKLFPHLVGERLETPGCPIPAADRPRVVLACTRIAKAEDTAAGDDRDLADGKKRTPQLIFLDPGHVEEFVGRLERLRDQFPKAYDYYLNPVAGFQQSMEAAVADSEMLDDNQQKALVKNAWAIGKLRLVQLQKFEGEENETDPPGEEGADPTPETADWIVERLEELTQSEEKKDKDLLAAILKAPNKTEKTQLKDAEPEKPKDYDKFANQLFEPLRSSAVDIALFGRMTTSDAFEDVEACLEVAHAISTNAMVREVDYFTAVDDFRTGAAAAHVGENQFASNTFYKYFSLDWDAFVKQLGGPAAESDALARTALRALIEAIVHAMPSGKKKGHANNNPPDAILIEVKTKKIPTNYANAFLTPAAATDGNPMDDSIRKLGHYVGQIARVYELSGQRFWLDLQGRPLVAGAVESPTELAKSQPTLAALIEAVEKAVPKKGAA